MRANVNSALYLPSPFSVFKDFCLVWDLRQQKLCTGARVNYLKCSPQPLSVVSVSGAVKSEMGLMVFVLCCKGKTDV